MWNLTESMSSPHHVVDERVVFAIGTSPTFMQNARGQFQNGRPSYLHVITPLNYLVEIVKIGENGFFAFSDIVTNWVNERERIG